MGQIDTLLLGLQSLKSLSNGDLVVIGRISHGQRPPEADQKKIKESNIWINIDTDPEQPHSFQIKELFIYGYKYKTNAQVVFYDGKVKEQLMSVSPSQIQKALFSHDGAL